MNPLAAELNEDIARCNPHTLEMLSELGHSLYFPKGILSQSAEAKEKAHRFNATIGIATEAGGPMHLTCFQEKLSAFAPKDLYPYAPPAGKPELRKLWQEKMLAENPTLAKKTLSNPVVTNALTHGLSIVADLFMEAGDHVLLPDMMWGNYTLTFVVRRGAVIKKYNTFTPAGGFDIDAFRKQLLITASEKGKAVVLLNFPNNPSGYSPTPAEVEAIRGTILEVAETGCNVVAVTDDAYFGLFYDDASLKESSFGHLAGMHPRVLAVKLDGATKEEFVWGFRVGFITFADGTGAGSEPLLKALEKKTMGIIRGTISNCPHPSQTFVINALQHPDFPAQKQQKFELLKRRANRVKEVLDSGRYDDAWSYYPFNSGYFMCLKLKRVEAERLRVHLLDQYGVGTISSGTNDLRIAFSCIEAEDIEALFDLIHQAATDLA